MIPKSGNRFSDKIMRKEMIMRCVVIRPQADGERTAAALRARGHEVLLAPLMQVEPVVADLSGEWRAVVITSANALPAASAAALKRLPLFAVGRRSADAARQAGFVDVTSADGDARDLVRLLVARRASNLIYLAGEDRAADLSGELATHGIAVETRVVYRAVTVPYPPALIDALRTDGLDAALHFSKRSADNYVAGARGTGLLGPALALRHYCLSPAVAAPLTAAGAPTVSVASRPEESALIDLLPQPAA
jgi:uroporphyrinogen-III synthase